VIRVHTSDSFPVTSTIIDEFNNQVSGESIYFDVRYMDDSYLVPPNTGKFVESTIASGIYVANITIDSPGSYVCYVTCSGFSTTAKEVLVEEKRLAELVWEHDTAQNLINSIDFIRAIEGGAWKIVNDMMVFFADDNVTQTAVFDLFNEVSIPAETNIYERRRLITLCYNCILDETGATILDEAGEYILDES